MMPHRLLENFVCALGDVYAVIMPEHRLGITFREDYEPQNGHGLPVPAIILGDKYAVFPTMMECRGGADEAIRIEELVLNGLPHEDPTKLVEHPDPHFCAYMLVQQIVTDWYDANFRKKRP